MDFLATRLLTYLWFVRQSELLEEAVFLLR